ncbi:DUF4190 domain-containing protein [Streptomyces sp. SD15]
MSDDAQTPQSAAGTPWASPDQGTSPPSPTDVSPTAEPADGMPADAIPADAIPEVGGATGYTAPAPKIALDKSPDVSSDKSPDAMPAARQPEPNPWAPPADPAPSRAGGAPTPPPPSVDHQPTVTSLPATGTPSHHPQPRPWDNPFAPPAAHAPHPRPAPGEPVPPPPIAPEGPGQIPYGYGYGQGYPAYAPPQAGHPGLPGYPGGVPGHGWPAMPLPPSNGVGTAALVLGIVAAAMFCLWPLAIVAGILAVIFGVIGRRKARRGEATNPGHALAGIICGAVGIVLGVAFASLLFLVPDDDGTDDPFTGDDGYSTSLVVQHHG